MAEIGDGAISAEDFIQDRSILRDSFFNEDGSYKWSEGIPMKRAWKFTPPIYRLDVIAKERIDSQATRQNAILLTEVRNAPCLDARDNQ